MAVLREQAQTIRVIPATSTLAERATEVCARWTPSEQPINTQADAQSRFKGEDDTRASNEVDPTSTYALREHVLEKFGAPGDLEEHSAPAIQSARRISGLPCVTE